MSRLQWHIILVLSLTTWCMSCANIMSPTGGPRDETAPLIRKRSLADSALNFKGGDIQFEFDEFVQLKDVRNQLMITPILRSDAIVKVHKKKVTITIPDSLLLPNTTYRISLGNAVQDLHEGNPYKNLDFTFSTGSYFDSLSLNGSVIDARTGMPDTSSWVFLYPAELPDSVFLKQKPMYAVKSSGGLFQFKNLPSKSFSIYSLKDLNQSLTYDAAAEQISFLNQKVRPDDTLHPIALYSFVEKDKVDTAAPRKSLNKNKDKGIADQKFNYQVAVDTLSPAKRTFDISAPLRIVLNKKISAFDISRIRLYQGDVMDASADIQLDTSAQILLLKTDWSEDAVYTLKLLKGFATDSTLAQASAGSYTFKTRRKSDYGFLTVLTDVNASNIIELLRNNKVIASKKATDTLISFPMLNPDNYTLRVWEDINGNGLWDTGSFTTGKKQPEICRLISASIAIKANWENKADIRPKPQEGNKQKMGR
ncbi:MAG: Ig-like domain-containing protein [Chitinophagaceae bacterium]|nr:Ig-like domain-containing protein [Chitinophagaceae bacterium]